MSALAFPNDIITHHPQTGDEPAWILQQQLTDPVQPRATCRKLVSSGELAYMADKRDRKIWL
ncbi:uncharacterized protein V6R79_006899 [Siganus canaliculatus]